MIYILKLSGNFLMLKFRLSLSGRNTAWLMLSAPSAAHLVAQNVQFDLWSFCMVLLTQVLCRVELRAARLKVCQNCVI